MKISWKRKIRNVIIVIMVMLFCIGLIPLVVFLDAYYQKDNRSLEQVLYAIKQEYSVSIAESVPADQIVSIGAIDGIRIEYPEGVSVNSSIIYEYESPWKLQEAIKNNQNSLYGESNGKFFLTGIESGSLVFFFDRGLNRYDFSSSVALSDTQ